MMMKFIRTFVLFFILCFTFISQFSFAVIIGSESTVSVQPLATFPASDTDNTMLGFGWFKNGFTLADATTTCTFNSVYPVSGPVNLNGGTLTLLQDLLFHNITTLNGWGTILGNNYAIDFCTSVTALPNDAKIFKDANIFLNSDMLVTSTITLQGDCSFSGHGHSLIMGPHGVLIIDSNASVAFQEMEIKGIMGSNIQCTDKTSSILLNDVVWEQSGDYTFSAGSILFQDTVTFMGTATFFYASSQTSTVDTKSTFLLTNGITLSIGRDPVSLNEPLLFTDSTSVLKLSKCGYSITSSGITLKKGTIFFENDVTASNNSTSFATGVTVGSGTPADDFTIYFAPGCSINQNGYLTYNNTVPNLFKSTTNTTKLTRNINSHILANTNFQMPNITVELVSNSVPSISVAGGAQLSFDTTTIELPGVIFDILGYQQTAFNYVLPGNGYINFSKGTLPLYLTISNTGNQILGNGNITGVVTLSSSTATLDFGINGYLGNTLTLNEGTISLSNDLDLYSNGIIVGPGLVNLSNRMLHINSTITTWSTPIAWQATSGGGLSLEQNVSLASTWTVQGNCIIDGNNNELLFLQNGQIVVGSNSQLYLKNIRLQSISDVNIQCLDNTGSIVLDNVYWTQVDDFQFQKGSILFKNEVDLVGSYTFFYASSQTSTIDVKSTLLVGDHMNLNIGKQQIAGAQEPLMLTDSSSLITVDNAQWSIVGNGMQLTKGRVICQNDVLVDIASTNSTQGLKLGDATQAGDLVFEFRPGTTVRMPRGHVVCNWFANNNLRSDSNTAQLIRNASNSFYVNNDIILSNLEIVTETGAPLILANGVTFGYSNCIFDVPGGTYLYTGDFYNAYTNLLNGNDTLSMIRGTLPLYTVVNGTGNNMDGNGSVTGQITYLSPSANLTWQMNGTLANNLSLNGGTFILANDLHMGNGALIIGPGDINMGSYLCKFGPQNITMSTPLHYNAAGGQIQLQGILSLASTWTVTGNCTIFGNGNTLDLGTTGQIVIDTGSTLTLENVILKNISNTNIHCVDDTGVLILDEITWSQLDDFTFGKGALIIKDEVYMTGGKTFNYETTQTSTINQRATWYFDNDTAFNYAPANSSQKLLEFADDSSTLYLFNTGIIVSAVGLQLLKGALTIDGFCTLQITGTTATTGLILGDGISSSNDISLTVMPESNLDIASGYVNYKNIY